MRFIAAPSEDPSMVYQTCVDSIADENLRSRLSVLTYEIGVAAKDYQKRAIAKELYTLKPNMQGKDDIVLGEVTKKEFTDVYSNHMVGRAKPARAIYDLLLSSAPLGRCPFCSLGYASTLDHYLPKTKYPQFSVVPFNLVPSCKDCNTGKSANTATKGSEQSLHPYFDHQGFIDEQWLFAEVIHSSPAAVRFYVHAPNHWDDVSKARVESHFRDFKLASRYSIEASNQIASLRDTLYQYRELSGANAVRQDLAIQACTYSRLHRNSWQTAMFQALAESEWYCEVGFCK